MMQRKRTPTAKNKFIWLKAVYHFHVFHYRMPQTVAIAAVTPFVPSPLTIKMAMLASLFQIGDLDSVQKLAENMHEIEVKIKPPEAAISFKAFLRYTSPPAVESEKGLDESGSFYPSRPHTREYAIYQGNLSIYAKVPEKIKNEAEKALKNIRYLGSKDSLVACIDFSFEEPPSDMPFVKRMTEGKAGVVVLLSDFNLSLGVKDLKKLIPGNRDPKMYFVKPYVLPGKIKTKGKTKIFQLIEK